MAAKGQADCVMLFLDDSKNRRRHDLSHGYPAVVRRVNDQPSIPFISTPYSRSFAVLKIAPQS
jgi:hypothetical protein